MKIAAADNNQARLRNLRNVLASIGHRSSDIEGFSEPTVALNEMRKKPFDLLFLAVDFGENRGGFSFMEKLNEDMRLRKVPVFLFGSNPTEEKILESSKAGARGFLAYPFSVSDVEGVIKYTFPTQ